MNSDSKIKGTVKLQSKEFDLTPEQVEKLIREKFERNGLCYDTMLKQREALKRCR